MTPSSDLFELISSLTPSEKRSFKIYASRHVRGKTNQYVDLFEAIEKQTKSAKRIYNEPVIRESFKSTKLDKQFPVIKNYLHTMVLDSLFYSHIDDDETGTLNKMVIQVSQLFKMRLYSHCDKLIKKIIKRAREIEAFDVEHKALIWKQRIIRAQNYIPVKESELDDVLDQKEKALNNLSVLENYEDIADRVFYLMRNVTGLVEIDKLDKIKKLFDHPFLQNEQQAINIRSQTLLYNTKSAYYYHIKKDPGMAYNMLVKVQLLLEENPLILINYPQTYMGVVHNSIILAISSENKKEALKQLETFRGIPDLYKIKTLDSLEEQIFFQSYSLETGLYIELAEYNALNDIISDIEDGLQKFDNAEYKGKQENLFYNICYLYFGIQDYKSALRWSNKMKEDDTFENLEGLTKIVKLLQAIIHYHLENFDFLQYYLRSLNKIFGKKTAQTKIELLIFNLLKKLIQVDRHSTKAKQMLVDIHEQLNQILDTSLEARILNYFDFEAWLISEIDEIPFVDAVLKLKEKQTINL